MSNRRPQSELYREAASRWTDLDSAARMLEESKTAVFSQKVNELLRDFPQYSMAKAEARIKGGDEWQQYIDRMVRARTEANRAKIAVEFERMRFWEQSQDRADERFTARSAT
jgi:hypothetical protein